jgi:hypothetical protein
VAGLLRGVRPMGLWSMFDDLVQVLQPVDFPVLAGQDLSRR